MADDLGRDGGGKDLMSVAPNPSRQSAREFLAQLLEEQNQLLTPVAEFSRAHERGEVTADRFAKLLPVTPLAPGEQYAFEVNLEKCSGCKACVTACHSLNGLDDHETWREVGLLVEAPKLRRSRIVGGTSYASPTPSLRSEEPGNRGTRPSTMTLQHVTTACHHCVDPGCLNGCPVLAYDKDPITGIVRHLDDQCIGCQYCVLKCPYDVPKYNSRLGIVRKCDMCSNRLAVGEAPACAQACPSEAIRITKVQTETVTIEFRERASTFLAGAPAGDYTVPTTRYVGAIAIQSADATNSQSLTRNLIAADHAELQPQPAHWPLVFMLLLTQASVGAACASVFSPALLWPALLAACAGLGASVFHLGRPLGAWRAFLNLRRSWMSREIVAFGIYPALLVAALMFPQLRPAAALTGIVAVFCSAMIYVDTRRELWRASRAIPLFLLTPSMLGAASALVIVPANVWFLVALVAFTIAKLAVETGVVRRVTDRSLTPMRKTALLITGRFQRVTMVRAVMAVLGGIGIPVLLSIQVLPAPQLWAAAGMGMLLAGELCERYLFFRCVVAPKMPGGLS